MAPDSAANQPWSLKMTVPLEPGIVGNNNADWGGFDCPGPPAGKTYA